MKIFVVFCKLLTLHTCVCDGMVHRQNMVWYKNKELFFIQGEGDRNKATITLLQTNFNAHLDKIMSVLADTKREQGKMKKQANHLNAGFRKAKKNILRISDGMMIHIQSFF